jgi:putative ABC transport system substrate-binding protein
MTTARRHHVRTRVDSKNRIAAVLMFAFTLLASLGWTGESWGQANVRRVGILMADVDLNSDLALQYLEPIRRILADRGWTEGQNILLEIRKPTGEPPQYADAAGELVRMKVDVIWATNAPAVRAAYAATRDIPIVAWDLTTDPVKAGYIVRLAQPGGNLTGVFLDAPEFAGKWVELLKAMIPGLSGVDVLWDPGPGMAHLNAVEKVAATFGVSLKVIEVHKPADIDRAFASKRRGARALIVLPSPMLYFQSVHIARQALKNHLIATSMFSLFAEAGGTMAYGPDTVLANESCAVLVAKILGGAKPGDLPVERPSKFKLVVNLKTAKALGITIPQSVLLRADEVIR